MCSRRRLNTNKTGKGFINTAINSLPFEVHVPSYHFCGPGTKLEKRLASGDKGINKLDSACREHDIAYSQSNDLNKRHIADKLLENRAWERVKAKDSSKTEKAVAYAVTNIMKVKRKIGMGCGSKSVNKKKNKNKNKKRIKKNRFREIKSSSQIGGILPLIPIFAGLSALGSIASGGSAVYNAIKNTRKSGGGLYLNPYNGKGLNSTRKNKKKKTN